MSRARKYLIRLSVWGVIVIGSTFVALVLFELMMRQARQDTVAMRVASAAYGVFDAELGVRYRPGTSISYAYLDSKGRVLECLPDISVTNADGFRGLDTMGDYEAARRRLLVSGDSFSHWNNDGHTIADYTKTSLAERGFHASLLNVAGGTFGLEHMVVHLAAAIEAAAELPPDLVAIQFIKDDITRGWWYVDTVTDRAGRLRARLGHSVACLAPNADCGSDEYLVDERATQDWCERRKNREEVDGVSADLVDTYQDIRGFFVYVKKAFSRLGIIDRQATSVIPRVSDIRQSNTARIRSAIDAIKRSGASILLVYLPTAGEIEAQKTLPFDDNERAILDFYEQHLGVEAILPADYTAFDAVSEFAISAFDSHPSVALQQAYGRYLSVLYADTLDEQARRGP